ncbi:MAG TPA: M20/M25/M40 family metallo-hydrolase [Frankiaceae bacterium]|nr:M20/M25/M40 family metallo-hydrolase [Frankiaceae bacterium]
MTITIRSVALLALAPALAAGLSAQQASTPRARRILADDRYLASDALAGRFPGTPGNDSAAAYIARELRRLGLRPGGDDGTYFQRWTIGNTSATRSAGAAGVTVANVVGILPGADRRLAGQDVVVGAHFDHLGRGSYGDPDGDTTHQIHNGADDNASGTAAALEIARILGAARPRPARTVVFVFFNGEEEGALGSAWYADHPAIPMDSTVAMVNLDMVGQIKNRRLMALGALSAAEWPALLDSANAALHLDVRASGSGWGPSDQNSFFAKKRPVIHFFEADLPDNYHRPADDWERVNADGIADVAALAADLVARLARRPGPLTFVDAPPPAPPTASTGARPVLGTIPDMASEPGGVLLQGVRAGSPAESAGIRAGDVLVGMGTHTIANLQDFQNALTSFHAGDTVEVRVRRGTQVVPLTVILGGR